MPVRGVGALKKRRACGVIAAAIVMAATAPAGVEEASAMPTVFPTGVTIYDKAAAYPCDVLFSAGDKTYLIDMTGKVVKQWNLSGQPAEMVDPRLMGGKKGVVGLQLDDVDASALPDLAGIGLVPGVIGRRVDKTFGFVDWNGHVLWKWSGPRSVGAAEQNHDWDRLPNGDTLILSDMPRAVPAFGNRRIIDDIIYEVSPHGNVVWRWSATDHLDEFGFTPAELELVERHPTPDYLHMNDMQVIGPNHWAQAGDERFAPGNIIFSSRNANITAIIDRKTGHLVWRIGPDYPPLQDAQPGALPRPIDQVSGQHDPHMIPEGLPGAGDILLFDNQGEAGYPSVQLAVLGGSRILEIDPAAKEIVWEYVASMSGNMDFTFFSPFISSAQRLPNGNTLIDEGIDSRFFQVTRDGKIVWEYVSPFRQQGEQAVANGQEPADAPISYRAQAIPLDWVPESGGASAADR